MAQTTVPTFYDHLKSALEAYSNPARLGEVSPLAAPYFLGQALRGASVDSEGRGKALCNEIDKTVESLWGGALPEHGQELLNSAQNEVANEGRGPRYDCLILELNYFKRRFNPAPKSQSEIYNDILHISRASHDRYLREAVERLGTALLRRVRPSLRLEQPTLTHELIGRDALIAQILTTLRAGQSVSLTGPGGIGKSSLAMVICEQWDSPSVFWFTVRPGVNDSLSGLLFALGYFLFQQGASTLWRQLVADGGKIKDAHLVSGLAQANLLALAQLPLLCIDEIDLLRRPTLEREIPHHTQLLELIDTLHAYAPLLLVGQQTVVETMQVVALDGLSIEQIAIWLRSISIPFEQEDVMRLHHYSAGNPRLLELCVAFYLTQQMQSSLAQALDLLPQSPAVPALWQRLQRRLNADERVLLSLLSVFRNPAPIDAWATATQPHLSPLPKNEGVLAGRMGGEALHSLLQRRLLRRDGQGGIYLLPALRTVIYHDLGIEARQQCHLLAAQIRAQRGEYTASAYHLCQADRPQDAVALWFPQREEEIRRGQANAALTIFEQVSLHRLEGKRQQELALLRAELYQLHGEPDKVVRSLENTSWPTGNDLGLEAARLWGNALDTQGYPDAALERYSHGIEQLSHLINRGTQLFVQRSMVHLRQRDLQQALRDAKLARFHAERMLGTVADQRGEIETAHAHYRTALMIVEELKYDPGIALLHHCLGILFSRQQHMDAAEPHFAQAMEFYDRIGDRMNREDVRGNLAAAYIHASQFESALEPAHKALIFFQQIGDSFSIAQNASNLAEAHAQLGHFAEAQHFAEIVLTQEEPHSHPYALFTLGTVFQKQSKWVEAELYFAQSKQLAQVNDDRFLLAYGWRALGEVYLETTKTDAARHALEQAHLLFVEMGIQDEIEKCSTYLMSL